MIRLLVSLLSLFILPHFASFNLVHKPHNVPCSQLIVFGDDFTDDGIEFGTYSHGFVRNSNGPVWPEYLNRMLECDEYINYAYSGAKSGYDNMFFSDWSGILWQIEYHFMSQRTVRKDSLIILQIGGLPELMSRQKIINGSINTNKIIENIAQAALGLISTIDNGMTADGNCIIILMNMIDPNEAPGYEMLAARGNHDVDVSSVISRINSKLRKLMISEGRENQQVGVFDLNAATVDATRGLNTNEPFTYRQDNMTSLKAFDYAYYNQWYPSTLVHHKIARKLVRFLEDL
uniref:SGNH hydrolase-type esterase domain-containing protein n=1 Tax=Setaria digitata TaxID=48799 RepID=A0A915PVB0_9BILA